MPKHDLPDGHEHSGQLIDISEHLRRRVVQSAQDNDAWESEPSDWEIYRHAEQGDGKLPRLGWHDGLWLGLLLAIGLMLWLLIRG
jgi:hypothetical protein